MAENVEYPVSVRLPGYVVRKIDELVKSGSSGVGATSLSSQ